MSLPLLRRGRLRLGIAVAVLVLVLDWATKSWVLDRLGGGQPFIDVLPFLNIVLTWNQGVSFGMFGGGRVPPLVLSLVSLAIVALLVRWLLRATLAWSGVALGLVVGGALGNVVDRVRYSAVVDFIDVHVQAWHWPAFNVADSAIVVGVLMLVLESLFARGTVSK